MSVKLIVFKSGEIVIADIKEGFDEGKLITYVLETPCTIDVNGKYRITNEEGDEKEQMSISLNPWPIFSADKVVPIVPDFVVTALEPTPGLKKMYERDVLNELDHTEEVIAELGESEEDNENDQ
jgi:hypothetical protein